MWLDAKPLFCQVETKPKQASSPSSPNSAQQLASSSSSSVTYAIDRTISPDVFAMRVAPLRLLQHPSVVRITSEVVPPTSNSSTISKSGSQQLAQNVPSFVRITSCQPTSVVPLSVVWRGLHGSEIVQGVFEMAQFVLFMLEKTRIRFTTFSSAQLYQDCPGSQQQQQANTITSENVPVSPLRYRWLLGDGRCFLDKAEVVTGDAEQQKSIEAMLLHGCAHAVACWLTDDVFAALTEEQRDAGRACAAWCLDPLQQESEKSENGEQATTRKNQNRAAPSSLQEILEAWIERVNNDFAPTIPEESSQVSAVVNQTNANENENAEQASSSAAAASAAATETRSNSHKEPSHDWSMKALRELIRLIHQWAVAKRNDAFTTTLFLGQRMHAVDNSEECWEILADCVTRIPSELASRRIWPWLVRPSFMSQKYAAGVFVKLTTFARCWAKHDCNIVSHEHITKQLGPQIASSMLLCLMASARDVFSPQRSNALDILVAAVRHKTVEGVSEEHKVAPLAGLPTSMLVRCVVPELLVSLLFIAGSVPPEVIGTPTNALTSLVNSVAGAANLDAATLKQFNIVAQPLLKFLAEKTAAWGGTDLCPQPKHKPNSENIGDEENGSRWGTAAQHLDALENVLSLIYELCSKGEAVQQQQSQPAQSSVPNEKPTSASAAATALRSRVFESLVAPTLAFLFIASLNAAKKHAEEKKNRVRTQTKTSTPQKLSPNSLGQSASTSPSKHFEANLQVLGDGEHDDDDGDNGDRSSRSSRQNDDDDHDHRSNEESEFCEEEEEVEDGFDDEEEDEESDEDDPSDTARIDKLRRRYAEQRARNKSVSSVRAAVAAACSEPPVVNSASRARRSLEPGMIALEGSVSLNESSTLLRSGDAEESVVEGSAILQGSVVVNSSDNAMQQSSNSASPVSRAALAVDQDECNETGDEEEESSSTPLSFLSRVSRCIARLLLVWHQPICAIQNPATRSLLWSVILRGVGVCADENRIKIPDEVVAVVFDPLVEVAMSSFSSLQQTIGDAVADQTQPPPPPHQLSPQATVAATIYFEFVQYLLPSLVHLSTRALSMSAIQLTMKMLKLKDFVTNLRTVLEHKQKRQHRQESQQTDQNAQAEETHAKDDDEEEDNAAKATEAVADVILPWHYSLSENNAVLLRSFPQDASQEQQQQQQQQSQSQNGAKLIVALWKSLPGLRDLSTLKPSFYKSGSLLSEIAAQASLNINQTTWLLNAINDVVKLQKKQHEAFATVTALTQGGSAVSCPPGLPGGIDSDAMWNSWLQQFILPPNGMTTNPERAVLLHLVARFGPKPFDAFSLMPPMP